MASAALLGLVKGLLQRAGIQMPHGMFFGIPDDYIFCAFFFTGVFLGVYEKLPGTKRKKSGL
jgi:hypothetical protein